MDEIHVLSYTHHHYKCTANSCYTRRVRFVVLTFISIFFQNFTLTIEITEIAQKTHTCTCIHRFKMLIFKDERNGWNVSFLFDHTDKVENVSISLMTSCRSRTGSCCPETLWCWSWGQSFKVLHKPMFSCASRCQWKGRLNVKSLKSKPSRCFARVH